MKKILKFFTLFLLLVGSITLISGCKKKVVIDSVSIIQESIPASILTTEVDAKISQIKIKIVKSDDSEEIINLSKSMISDTDYAKLANEGTHTLIVTCEGIDLMLTLNIKKPVEDNPGGNENPGGNTEPEKEKIEYSVLVKDQAGKPLSDFYVTFYSGSKILDEGYTLNTGIFKTNLVPDQYKVVVEGREGYYLNNDRFETDLIGSQIEVEAIFDKESLIGKSASLDHRYELGDLMYDFTITDTEKNKLNLYELLTEYKAVIINFWYATCSACQAEFPYMVQAYESTYEENGVTKYYKDDICIIAVNPGLYESDTLEGIKNFKNSMNLSFNVALDNDGDKSNKLFDPELTTQFSDVIGGYPTTVIIDSFGVIAEIGVGAVTDATKWTYTFDKYIDENYYPTYSGEVNEEVVIKPDIEQEDSSVLEAAANGTNYDGTPFTSQYSPEDNENDKEYSWPWVVTTYAGKECIKPSNKDINSSFSIVYTTVHLNAGEVFAFDYFASTEEYDVLYVTVDGIIGTSISKKSSGWETSYAFVAIEDKDYEFGFCYFKDGSFAAGEDAVFITNVRILKEEHIDKPTYIYRECATGLIDPVEMKYAKYVDVFFNEEDGYYHVNSINGPLLFADLLSGTNWNLDTLYDISLEGLCIGADDKDYNALVEEYAVYASNSTIGYTPVTQELATALQQITKALGHEAAADNLNQWLELCVYYSAYATDGSELGLPTYGVCPWEPIMLEGNALEEAATGSAVFDRIILPRGFIFGFTPTVSGVYKFYSLEEIETQCWFCDEDGITIQEQEYGLRQFAADVYNGVPEDTNCIMYVYLEAGKTYLFRAAFYDVTEYSEISVALKYIADKAELLTIASPGFFTSSDDEMSDIIAGNYVDVELGTDGYYKVKDSQASDAYVYADILYANNITGYSLLTCLSEKFNAFDFSLDEFGNKLFDEEGYARYTGYNENDELVRFYVCYKGEEYFYVETVGEGEYTEENGYTYEKYTQEEIEKLGQADFTEYVQNYIDANMITDKDSELYGCVIVDEKFAIVLGLLMDKYTFPNVDYSWVKLCYYYNYLGPVVTE